MATNITRASSISSLCLCSCAAGSGTTASTSGLSVLSMCILKSSELWRLITKADMPTAHPALDVRRSADTWRAAARNFAAPATAGSWGMKSDTAPSATSTAFCGRSRCPEPRVVHAWFFECSPEKLPFGASRARTREPVFAANMEISWVRPNQQSCRKRQMLRHEMDLKVA